MQNDVQSNCVSVILLMTCNSERECYVTNQMASKTSYKIPLQLYALMHEVFRCLSVGVNDVAVGMPMSFKLDGVFDYICIHYSHRKI